MDLTAGYPFFLINDGLLYHYPKLTDDQQCQVCIIGGGISGALTAYYMVEAGMHCVLVDSRTIALGSTCASTSLLQYELDTPLHQLIEQVGKPTAQRAYQLCGLAIEKLVAIMKQIGYEDYEKNQSLFFSSNAREKSFMEKEYRARKDAGFDIEQLTGDEIKALYGLKARHGLLSAIGGSINAYTLTHHLLQYCIKKGLRVYDRSSVAAIEQQSGGVKLITGEGQVINAAVAVNATGYEVVNFIDKDIVNFDCTYAIVSEHQSEKDQLWKDRIMMWNTDDPYLYIRLTKDNRIIAGGRDERFSNKVTRQMFLEKKARLLEKDVHRILPDVPFKKEFAWSGTFGKTKDSLPYIGPYHKTPSVYYALGFGGNGITFSQIAAEIICDLLQGINNPDAELFSFTR